MDAQFILLACINWTVAFISGQASCLFALECCLQGHIVAVVFPVVDANFVVHYNSSERFSLKTLTVKLN